MSAQTKLIELAEAGFAMAGESSPLGFDVDLITPTLSKMPTGIDDQLRTLFAESWPSDFFLGAIEIIGPDRINLEHEELYPGLTLIQHGFICIGSDGGGAMYAYSLDDKRVYLFSSDNFSDDGITSDAGTLLAATPESIKSLAIESWDSLESLFA